MATHTRRPASGPADLGSKLKEIRRSKRVTLQQVADGAGLSKSFISLIESGGANPSIGSLKKIANVLGVPLGGFFDHGGDPDGTGGPAASNASPRETPAEVRVVRCDRRKTLSWPGRGGLTYLLTPDLQRKLEVILTEMQPGDGSGEELYSHSGEEFGFVLEGRYEVTVGEQVFVLETGDSIYYPSHIPHKTRVLGSQPVKTLWVITPPSF